MGTFCHDWSGPAPEPTWLEALDRLSPRSEGRTWLHLLWEPGEPWCPVERWIVYEMIPLWMVPMGDALRRELAGPNPRAFGHYDTVLERFVRVPHPDAPKMISQRQWLLFRETGFYGRPIWVVQGSQGGNKRFFTEIESQLSLMHGGTEEPPAPGELGYAVPDNRTTSKLRGMDLVARFGDVLHAVAANGRWDALDRREQQVAQDMAEQMWGWLETQMGELRITRKAAKEFWDNAPAGDDDAPAIDYEAEQAAFVEEIASAAMT